MSAASLPQSAVRYGEARNLLADGLMAGRLGAAYASDASDATDAYFTRRLEECADLATGAPFALAAVGGYGRRELCPGSDLDVLVIYADDLPLSAAGLAKCLFHPLWDMGLEVGHGVRSVDECLSLAAGNFQVFASFLDLRFLAGDRTVFATLSRRLDEALFPSLSGDFLAWLAEANKARGARFGEAGAMLEPNLKEGLGGLRDYHQALWLMRLAEARGNAAGRGDSLFAEEWEELRDHASFLLTVRGVLHVVSRRKNDKLHFEYQEKAAEVLGYSAMDGALAVEVFLAALLRRMAEVKALREALWPVLFAALGAGEAGAPSPDSASTAGQDNSSESGDGELAACGLARASEGLSFLPGLSDDEAGARIPELFRASARLGVPLDYETRRRVRREVRRLAGFAAGDPLGFGKAAFEAATAIMMRDASDAALDVMLETGVLAALVPEFARVSDLVRFDVYHVHPVGRHTVEAIRRLRRAAAGEGPFAWVFPRLRKPERLYWGAFFHDIGKGLGGGHAEKGARIAEEVMRRLGFADEDVADVVFLVRNHLFLAERATSRDLTDKNALARWAARMGGVDRLDMLVLLTWADSLATGPSAWSSWKESLVSELHARLRTLIASGRLFDEHDASRMLWARDKVRGLCADAFPLEELEARLENMPPRYLVNVAPEDIAAHLSMLRELDAAIAEDKRMVPGGRGGRGVAVLDCKPAPCGGFTLTLAAMYARRLFVTAAGVLALHDVNIVSGEAYVFGDDAVIQRFRVDDPPDILFADEVWARVRRAIKYAQTGKLSLDYRLAEKRNGTLARRAGPGSGRGPDIAVDNAASELFTLIQVEAADRIGLLYDIAHVLCDLDLEVHLVKAATSGDRIRDVFYVRGAEGAKIEDRVRLTELRRALAHRLSA